ncbi:MAG: hypothetical protein AAGD07_15340 [Planctomycetota bacterium]
MGRAEVEPMAMPVPVKTDRLWGVLLAAHSPLVKNNQPCRISWFGVRSSMAGAISAAVLYLREYGLDARTEHATDVIDFGVFGREETQALARYYVKDTLRRGIECLGVFDRDGNKVDG